MQNYRFSSKSTLLSKKVCYKVYFRLKTVRFKVVRHWLAYLPVQIWFTGTSPTTWKFGQNWPTPSKTPISYQYSLVYESASYRLSRNT